MDFRTRVVTADSPDRAALSSHATPGSAEGQGGELLSPQEHGRELERLRGHAGGSESLLKSPKTLGGIGTPLGEGPRCRSPALRHRRQQLQMAFCFSAIKNLI